MATKSASTSNAKRCEEKLNSVFRNIAPTFGNRMFASVFQPNARRTKRAFVISHQMAKPESAHAELADNNVNVDFGQNVLARSRLKLKMRVVIRSTTTATDKSTKAAAIVAPANDAAVTPEIL